MNASDPQMPLRPTAPSREERVFPTLTTEQIKRIAARGRRRAIARGDVLVEVGDNVVPFFVLTISRQRGGGCNGRPICSKRVVRAFLRSATYRAATSSASPPPLARDQLLSPLFIKCFTSKGR